MRVAPRISEGRRRGTTNIGPRRRRKRGMARAMAEAALGPFLFPARCAPPSAGAERRKHLLQEAGRHGVVCDADRLRSRCPHGLVGPEDDIEEHGHGPKVAVALVKSARMMVAM